MAKVLAIPLNNVALEKCKKKKLADVNDLFFRATAPYVIPTRARGMTSVYA